MRVVDLGFDYWVWFLLLLLFYGDGGRLWCFEFCFV